MSQGHCRFCQAPLRHVFVDLGLSPLSNAYVAAEALNSPATFYPLKSWVCEECLLVQLESFEAPEHIFSDYLYFSSYSSSWLDHARRYVDMITDRLHLTVGSQVIEIASNDGYLLQYFQAKGIPALGIEPAANVADIARAKGIETLTAFFGTDTATALARQGMRADLVLGNNVLAHVPDLNDFVAGLPQILQPEGVATFEFPHLLALMRHTQFDTIYHEHFSYFSLWTVIQVFEAHGLRLFDVETLPTHGGSLRIYAARADSTHVRSANLDAVLASEAAAGLHGLPAYLSFAEQVYACKRSLLRFLIEQRDAGRCVAGYGAPAKGNTLLNFCGVRADLLPYTVDISPHKQGRYLPGTLIPILAPSEIDARRPDFVLILPWNLQAEITAQLAHIRRWGGRFVIPVPQVEILE